MDVKRIYSTIDGLTVEVDIINERGKILKRFMAIDYCCADTLNRAVTDYIEKQEGWDEVWNEFV